MRSRSRKNDHMSIILMLIVTVFVICNLPRLILNMHEITGGTSNLFNENGHNHQNGQNNGHFELCWLIMVIVNFSVIDDITRCKDTDLGGFPVWSILLGSSYTFLYYNHIKSSHNCLYYIILIVAIITFIIIILIVAIPHICHRHHRRCLCKKNCPV